MANQPHKVAFTYYLIAHSGTVREPEPVILPSPVVVASITCDPRFIGGLNAHKELTHMASKMGILDFEVTTAEAQDRPGHQMGLPFPRPRSKY